MSEMVEKVARAMFEDAWPTEQGREDAMKINPGIHNGYRKLARAAIAAMREPTEAMKAAGATRIPEAGYDLAHDAYVTMIDAALTEERTGE